MRSSEHDKVDPAVRREPRYVAIEEALARAIADGRLQQGAILTEGRIAELFGTSRTPVRMALGQLERGGTISRFDGRGFVVNGSGAVVPERVRLTRQMLGLGPKAPTEPQPASAERIARTFEEFIALALPFGQFRINEQAAANHFSVSRNVIRELLSRFQDRGLVRKNLRSHWVVGPLTASDLAHFYSIRGKLEPLALVDSAPLVPSGDIERMRINLSDALAGRVDVNAECIENLETDIHIRLLARSPNTYLLRMIRQIQIALVVNRLFANIAGGQPFEIALREHMIVLDFVVRGSHDAAAAALAEHLKLSAERTRQRLMAISVFPEPQLPEYLQRQAL